MVGPGHSGVDRPVGLPQRRLEHRPQRNVAHDRQQRVLLDKNKALVVVNDDGHVLGYEPGVPDAPGWKLAVSRQTRNGTPVIIYKAVGPAMVILLK